MTEKEVELFKLIYENDNPGEAVLTAIKVFAAFLEQLEADREPHPVCLRESS